MASVTPVIIANIALAELGTARITNLNDGSKNAGLVSTFYDTALEYALVMHPWNFAIKRLSQVAERATPPEWGFSHAYTFPTNGLKILSLGKDGREVDTKWQSEADSITDERIIVTNLPAPIDMKFICKVTNTQMFSAAFVITFSKVLKWFLAKPITGRKETKDEAHGEMLESLKASMSNDGQEGTPQDYTPHDLEDVR